ncbi:helix-turn-helix transcriptional regulator (plasmid) [Chloroflexota bacterium]|nr:helix-turn-helix transcriptional regulator [Chloroflexota bacterium]
MHHNLNRDGIHGPGGGRGRRPGRGRRWMGDRSLMDVRLIEPALLAFLSKEPQHGYALLERLDYLGLGGANPSAIYRVLRDFEEIGLVKSDWDSEGTQGPPRRVYVLTDEGRAALKRAEKSLQETCQKINALLEIVESE